jgi:hypothetical protein
MVAALAKMGDFTDPGNTAFLAGVLEGRLERLLDRYLTRLSPITDVRVEAGDQLCAVDLAERRGVRDAAAFKYVVRLSNGTPLVVTRRVGAEVCVTLPRVAGDGGSRDDAAERYLRVRLDDGVAQGPLVVHLYDLGPARGYQVVRLDRPER